MVFGFKGENTGIPRPLKAEETSDCPVYLRSQGKKWSPYIKVTDELCSRCPFFGKQCNGYSWQVEEKK